MSVTKERCFIGFQFTVILCNNHIHQEEVSEGYESEGLERGWIEEGGLKVPFYVLA
jgi:hypothetical protein